MTATTIPEAERPPDPLPALTFQQLAYLREVERADTVTATIPSWHTLARDSQYVVTFRYFVNRYGEGFPVQMFQSDGKSSQCIN